MDKSRLLYWDTLKGILICLVVLGHCGTALGDGVLSVIYSFHMPLFILISGYFSKKYNSIKQIGLKRLIEIFLLFNCIYIILDILTIGISFHRLLIPSFALWYILSLIYWRLCMYIMPKEILDKPFLTISISLVISILVGFIPIGNEIAFQRTFVFFPFFIIGYYLRQYNIISLIRKTNKYISIITISLIFAIVYFNLPPFYANSPFRYDSVINDCFIRILQLIIGTILCFCILAITPEKISIITRIGMYTLLIYLLHPPIIKILKELSIKLGYTPDIFSSIIISIVTIIILYSIRNIKIIKKII